MKYWQKKAYKENILGDWDSDFMDHIMTIEQEIGILTCNKSERLKIMDRWGKALIKEKVLGKSILDSLPMPNQG